MTETENKSALRIASSIALILLLLIVFYFWSAMPVYAWLARNSLDAAPRFIINTYNVIYKPAEMLADHSIWYHDFQSEQFYYWTGWKSEDIQ